MRASRAFTSSLSSRTTTSLYSASTGKSRRKGREMKTTEQAPKQKRCPSCEKGVLRPTVVTELFEHEEDGRSMVVSVPDVPVEVCTHCGEKFHGPEAARLHHRAICKAFGFLTPELIKSIREDVLGLTQEEF